MRPHRPAACHDDTDRRLRTSAKCRTIFIWSLQKRTRLHFEFLRDSDFDPALKAIFRVLRVHEVLVRQSEEVTVGQAMEFMIATVTPWNLDETLEALARVGPPDSNGHRD
jgi:hypothetical protein